MADVFLSYRNTSERKAIVVRLELILKTLGLEVWWDKHLQSGDDWSATIAREVSAARAVIPLWCWESVHSQEVAKEVRLGLNKLLPLKIQRVLPPQEFGSIHAHDLIGWDGDVFDPSLREFLERLSNHLSTALLFNRMESLRNMPAISALPSHDLAAQRILERLQEQFMLKTQDGLASTSRIQMWTPASELLENYSSSHEFADEVMRFCLDAHLRTADFDDESDDEFADDYDNLIELHDTWGAALTVGHVVHFLCPPTEEGQAAVKKAIAKLLENRKT